MICCIARSCRWRYRRHPGWKIGSVLRMHGPGALVEEGRAGGDPIAEDGLMEADRRPNASRQLPIR